MRVSFDMPCNLCPVVATLELTANCVKETLPIVRRRSSSNWLIGNSILDKNFRGFILKKRVAFLGGFGQCSKCLHCTSSTDTVLTFLPSQFFQVGLAPGFNVTPRHLQVVPFPLPLSKSSFVLHMYGARGYTLRSGSNFAPCALKSVDRTESSPSFVTTTS